MIRFAIIGTGNIADQHALGVIGCKKAELVAVCDMNQERAKAFADKYGITKIYADSNDLLADPDVDAVCICTPSGTHGVLSIAAAKAGKHILCEKPIEIKADKIDALVAEVEKNNVKMQCVYQSRFDPIALKAKAALDSGEFGKVLMASVYMKYYRSTDYYKSAGWRATWDYDGGGCLMNQGVHGIDLLCWFMGGVKKVNAITRTVLHNIEVEDAAVAAVEFENGAVGVIEGSTCVVPAQSRRFEIHCENGSMIFDETGIIKWYLNGEAYHFEGMEAHDAGIVNDDPLKNLSNKHGHLVDELVECIENDTEPSIGPREARKAVDTILAIYKSSREGKEVLV